MREFSSGDIVRYALPLGCAPDSRARLFSPIPEGSVGTVIARESDGKFHLEATYWLVHWWAVGENHWAVGSRLTLVEANDDRDM
jgi:hypothetical protein